MKLPNVLEKLVKPIVVFIRGVSPLPYTAERPRPVTAWERFRRMSPEQSNQVINEALRLYMPVLLRFRKHVDVPLIKKDNGPTTTTTITTQAMARKAGMEAVKHEAKILGQGIVDAAPEAGKTVKKQMKTRLEVMVMCMAEFMNGYEEGKNSVAGTKQQAQHFMDKVEAIWKAQSEALQLEKEKEMASSSEEASSQHDDQVHVPPPTLQRMMDGAENLWKTQKQALHEADDATLRGQKATLQHAMNTMEDFWKEGRLQKKKNDDVVPETQANDKTQKDKVENHQR